MAMTEDYLFDPVTTEHIEAQEKFASRVERYWGVKCTRMKDKSRLDYAIEKDGFLSAWIELKCRSHVFGTFPEYMIELKKWNALRDYTATTNLKAFIGVGFTDGDFWVNLDDISEWRVAYGGRTDRNCKKDVGSMVYFDIKFFKQWKTA